MGALGGEISGSLKVKVEVSGGDVEKVNLLSQSHTDLGGAMGVVGGLWKLGGAGTSGL